MSRLYNWRVIEGNSSFIFEEFKSVWYHKDKLSYHNNIRK